MALQQTFNQFSILGQTKWQRGLELYQNLRQGFRLSQQMRIAPHPLILLPQATFLYSHQMNWPSCSLAMCPMTFPQPLPTSQKVKRPLSYYSFIVQVQLVKNYPYNLNSLGRPRWGICSIPPGILRIKIRG